MNITEIFREKPTQFGLRGDVFFWNYLDAYFYGGVIFPYTKEQLEIDIYKFHLLLTKEILTKSSTGHVESFDNGIGISSGLISGEWWIKTGIPILKTRLANVSNE